MVHVYNCHPFSSQQIVQVEQEPGLVCCGGGALFVVTSGGCKVEAYNLEQEGSPLICRFATMGTVKTICHCSIGDYLVAIEEKNYATYLRAYTNWRFQAEEKARVGVRLLGHLLRGASVRGGVQMEIIEIPMSERPLAVACCPVTGDLLVLCENKVILFNLKKQNQQSLEPHQQSSQRSVPSSQQTSGQGLERNVAALDFDLSVILHLSTLKPKKSALCAGYIALQSELEVLVLKLDASSEATPSDETLSQLAFCDVEEQTDFFILPRHLELLGDRAKDCDIPITIEKTGLEDGQEFTVSYILFKRFTPEFFQGCNVEETQIHSLQLHPLFIRNQVPSAESPACVFCFFSLPNTGYLYSLKEGVELLSAYQYPEKVQEAVLTHHLLHVITRGALQSFTVRCASVAARVDDPYIDTTMKACPPSSLEVCALRMQMFIGLRSVCVYGHRVVLLSRADVDTLEDPERVSHRKGLIRKRTSASPKETNAVGHGWNLYVVNTVPPLMLYQEMVEYSQSYSQANPHAQSLRHLLSEAHLLLKASLLTMLSGDTDGLIKEREELEAALRDNCAQLGDCFSRGSQKDCHLALPYYRMSGLTIPEVMARNQPRPSSPRFYGPGFLFYLKHYLLEEVQHTLNQHDADGVIDIFHQSEPLELVAVCCRPSMMHACPARTMVFLRELEESAGVSVTLTITQATMALRLDDMALYKQLMDRHSEMQLVYGFIEEPQLLLHGAQGGHQCPVRPTALASEMARSQPGLLVAAMVALQENNKVKLEQADHVFKVLGCCENNPSSLQVDFWEAQLTASSQEPLILELLFRVTSVYIERLTHTLHDSTAACSCPDKRPLKSADDLIGSCSHYGALYPWLSVLCPVDMTNFQHREALHKLQSLLCGPSLSTASVVPLLDQISEETLWGFSVHLLCATRRGHYSTGIEKLLDRCPQAIIAYANHHLQDTHTALWWQKLLPEICNRTRASMDCGVLLTALKETLVVVSAEISPSEFLELIPNDGTAAYFLPHLLTCSQRHLTA